MKRKDPHVGDLAIERSHADQRRGLTNRVVTRGRVLEWMGAISTLSFVPWFGMAAQPQEEENNKQSEEKSRQSPGLKAEEKRQSPGQKPAPQPARGQQPAGPGQQPAPQPAGQQPSEEQQEAQQSEEQQKQPSGCLGTIVYCLCFLAGLSMLLLWTV
jgi:cobalamin biosynthesis Mg chelatase CobN